MRNGAKSIAHLTVAGLLTLPSAFGSLILIGPNPDSGQGLGAVSTILTLQSQGSNQEESGCVGPGTTTTGCGFTNNTVQPGANTTVRDITSIDAGNLRFVFNASEPGMDNLIVLNEFVITVYNGSTPIFTSSGLRDAGGNVVNSATGLSFNPFSGTGNSGYLFRLTNSTDGIAGDDQAGALQAVLDAQAGGSSIFVGVGARLTEAAAGLETFSLRAFTEDDGGSDVTVPEPSTYLLIGIGFVALGLIRRKQG